MRLGRKGATALGSFALALTLSLGVPCAGAASACKGLESGPCQKKDDCVWVNPYQRKDGVKVSGHCKSKPKKAAKSSSEKTPEAVKKKKEAESRN